jgi:hypothetical protein
MNMSLRRRPALAHLTPVAYFTFPTKMVKLTLIAQILFAHRTTCPFVQTVYANARIVLTGRTCPCYALHVSNHSLAWR